MCCTSNTCRVLFALLPVFQVFSNIQSDHLCELYNVQPHRLYSPLFISIQRRFARVSFSSPKDFRCTKRHYGGLTVLTAGVEMFSEKYERRPLLRTHRAGLGCFRPLNRTRRISFNSRQLVSTGRRLVDDDENEQRLSGPKRWEN